MTSQINVESDAVAITMTSKSFFAIRKAVDTCIWALHVSDEGDKHNQHIQDLKAAKQELEKAVVDGLKDTEPDHANA